MSKSIQVAVLTVSAELGGTERVLLDLAKHSSALGIDLTVVLPRPGPLVDELESLDVSTTILPAPKWLLSTSRKSRNPFRFVRAFFSLLRWSRELRSTSTVRKADVLYSIGFKAHLATLFCKKRPLVWHLHEFPPHVTGTVWRWIVRGKPDRVIANSEAVARAWANNSTKPNNITTVLNGVDLDKFTPQAPTHWMHRELNIPEHRRLIGMPAVFASWKGHHQVLEAFSIIQDSHADVDLVFVGGPIYDTAAEQTFAADLKRELLGAADDTSGGRRVHIIPFQSQVEKVYPEFELTLHYSVRPEPFGRVIVESMACGVPVIVSNEGGPPEILGPQPDECGWLAPPTDAKQLAATLDRALRIDAEARERMGKAARRRAEDFFSAERFAKGVVRVFKDAVQTQHHRSSERNG